MAALVTPISVWIDLMAALSLSLISNTWWNKLLLSLSLPEILVMRYQHAQFVKSLGYSGFPRPYEARQLRDDRIVANELSNLSWFGHVAHETPECPSFNILFTFGVLHVRPNGIPTAASRKVLAFNERKAPNAILKLSIMSVIFQPGPSFLFRRRCRWGKQGNFCSNFGK